MGGASGLSPSGGSPGRSLSVVSFVSASVVIEVVELTSEAVSEDSVEPQAEKLIHNVRAIRNAESFLYLFIVKPPFKWSGVGLFSMILFYITNLKISLIQIGISAKER